MRYPKEDLTEELRRLVLAHPGIVETDYAEAGLTTLSFTSEVPSNRHVWADTDLGGTVVAELEDWLSTERWDNSVGFLTAANLETIAKIISAWLSGRSLDECRALGGVDVDFLK
jgi:hypothetical protein